MLFDGEARRRRRFERRGDAAPVSMTGTASQTLPPVTTIDRATAEHMGEQVNARRESGYVPGGSQSVDVGQRGVPDTRETRAENLPTTVTTPSTSTGAAESGTSGDLDDWIEEWIRQNVRGGIGPIDTAAHEALIRELGQEHVGQGLLNARARMGAAGFGSSGALYGLEGDVRRQAARDVAEQILGVRDREEQQAFERAEAAAGMDIRQREAANRAALLQAQLDALAALLGGGDGAPVIDDGNGGGDVVGQTIAGATGISSGTSPFGKGTDQTQRAASGIPSPEEYDSLPRADAPPPNGEVFFSRRGDFTIYRVPRADGSGYDYVRVDG
jgi:hypothetical protein